jgi:hypothetical protein
MIKITFLKINYIILIYYIDTIIYKMIKITNYYYKDKIFDANTIILIKTLSLYIN